MVAAFMTAIPLSGVIGSPISGWLLERMSSIGGLRGWQWLFLIEAIPSLLAGVLTMFVLSNGPQTARWLNESEREVLLSNLRADEDRKRSAAPGHHNLSDAFRSGRVWILCVVYFGINMGNYGVSFWMPQIIKDSVTPDPLNIGLLSMIPWAIGAVAMVWVGHHSDVTGERRWHVGLVCILGAAGLALSAVPGIPPFVVILALAMATSGIIAGSSTFWSLPTSYLTGAAATAGIAWINSVGNLGGYLGPWAIGKIKDMTQSITWAMLLLSAGLLVSATLAVLAFRRRAAT
jgi:nitrate/nitrite transporter NarK